MTLAMTYKSRPSYRLPSWEHFGAFPMDRRESKVGGGYSANPTGWVGGETSSRELEEGERWPCLRPPAPDGGVDGDEGHEFGGVDHGEVIHHEAVVHGAEGGPRWVGVTVLGKHSGELGC